MTDKKILKKYINTKSQPRLLPYIDDIKFLVENNASQQSILDFLQIEKNITVCKSTVSIFIKKYINKEPFIPKEKESIKSEQNIKPKKLRSSIFDD